MSRLLLKDIRLTNKFNLTTVLLLSIILSFSVFSFINIFCLDTNLNSEISFEIIFANQIKLEKSIFPTNFYYGYELSALRPAFLAAILDFLIGNMLTSMPKRIHYLLHTV